MIRRAFRFRLAPTEAQAALLDQWAGATRFVYNLCLEQRRDFWRQYRSATGGSLNFATQGREVTALRQQVDWLRDVPSGALTQALRDLDKAFANFFSGRARFPGFRARGRNDSFRVQAKETAVSRINDRWSVVRVPKVGWIKFRNTRLIEGRLLSVTLIRDALGWHVCFACEIEHAAPANDNPSVGIDRGVAVSLALSNGETFQLPDLDRLDRQRRRAQRVLSRRKRGSNRRRKQRLRVARLAARIARVRANWQHKVSCDIAARFGLVVIEDLNTKGMSARGSGKRGLNRSILNQAWGAFADKLTYKVEASGGTLAKVRPAYSSQTCSDCGAVDPASRKSQSAFACVHCGFTANADHNAAIIILRRSTPELPVEGRGCAPCEAGTCEALAA